MSATLSSGDAVTAQVKAPAGLASATKRFGGVIAIRDVTFDLIAGEVLALLGENGAGKSTCVKLLAGVYQPDAGAVLIDGRPAESWSPVEASRRGVAVVHQHPGLFGDLSVYENVFLRHMPKRRLGGVDDDRMRRRTSELLDVVGLACRPDRQLRELRTSEQQLVEIVRALSVEARVLIMDEPTAALSQREVERLFGVVSSLRAHGVAMMFVSHRMDEIYRVADRIAVLRDGRLIGTGRTGEIERDEAVRMMVGRPLSTIYPQRRSSPGPLVLETKGLSRKGAFADVSFTVRAGEVLGLGGLVGSGRTEVARVLFGVDRPTAGEIKLAGEPTAFSDPSAAVAGGVAYVSEDRLGQSLVMDFPILANASLPAINRVTFAGFIRRRSELALVEPHLQRLRLKFRNFDQPVKTLSGGNQQKVVLSKWLAATPRLLILDEPTQGVDVQSKAEVHAMIAELAAQGLAIILISSELPELIGMCDRIVVLREGRQTATFARADADAERVIRAAMDVDADVALIEEGRRRFFRDESEGLVALVHRVFAQREIGLVCAMAAVVIPVTLINPRMIGGENLTAIAMDAALLMIVAVGQMLVMLTRNIDLSVASVIGLSAYGAASFMHNHSASPVLFGVGVASLVGLGCGLLNGLVVTLGGVPSIVVTLGSLAVFRGFVSLWAGGRQISADQVPQAWLDMTGARILGVPAVVLIALAVLIAIGAILRRSASGREIYAIGSNPDGAALVGIRATLLVVGAFAAAGLLAGFDGALWASRYATIDARVAMGFELTVIASVVVGGVAIRGGAGTVLGVALGALTLLVIQNGLTLVRVDPLWLQGVYGVVILAAVAIDALVGRRSRTGRSP
ncbi:MAG TPA: ATP-binding cassette domain-containing protein [Roseiarcus sp.]|nr:ATP-binding cassette domain-containing protein [Roseiarcus sp.]